MPYLFKRSNLPESTDPSKDERLVNVFVGLVLFSGIGLILVVATAALFSKCVRRSRVWYAFCAAWIIYCVSCVLLFLSGQQKRENPDHGVCLAQSVLMYSGPPLCATATISLMLEIRWRILAAYCQTTALTNTIKNWLIFAPFTVWFTLNVLFFTFGSFGSSTVRLLNPKHSKPYCTFEDDFPRIFTSALTASLLFIACSLIVSICFVLKMVQQKLGKVVDPQYRAVFIRLVILTFMGMFNIGHVSFLLVPRNKLILQLRVGIFSASNPKPGVGQYIAGQGVAPVVTLLVFGSQEDLWSAWRSKIQELWKGFGR